jgi:hypothetical protein
VQACGEDAVRSCGEGAVRSCGEGNAVRGGGERGAGLGEGPQCELRGARVSAPFYVSWAQRRPSDHESRVRMTWAEHSNGLILRFRPITV